MNILIIEDSPSFQFAHHNAVKDLDFNPLLVSSAEEALNLLDTAKQTIDLIIMDVQLPGISGFEATHLIKTHPKHRKIPVIIVSCSEKDSDYIKARQIGAEAFLKKPFTPKQLNTKINRIKSKAKLPSASINDDDPQVNNQLCC